MKASVGHLAAEHARPPCKLQVADCGGAEDWPKSAPRWAVMRS